MINHFEGQLENEDVKFITGVTINQVNLQNGSFKMYDQQDRRYIGTILLVAVPVSIAGLASGEASIEFSPGIDKWRELPHKLNLEQ